MEANHSKFTEQFKVRWADCDINTHMRHSAFYDYAAHIRVSMFDVYDLPVQRLIELRIGPVLFREEAKFYKELRLNESFAVDCEIKAMRKTGKVWQITHHFYNSEGLLAAELEVDGSWIDLDKRKSTTPNSEIFALLCSFPRSENFYWLEDKR